MIRVMGKYLLCRAFHRNIHKRLECFGCAGRRLVAVIREFEQAGNDRG